MRAENDTMPSFSFRRIVGQTLMALSLLLTLAVYDTANPQNSAPANSNAPSTMIRDFE